VRLAYFSPLNPAPSGVSDYSEELLPHLAAFADITLVVDGYTLTNRELAARFPVLDHRAYTAQNFDLALYHLGNSPAHAYIYQRALKEPGVIVLHDLVLHHLVAWLTLNHGDAGGYDAALREAYGERGANLAQRSALPLDPLHWFDFPLSEAVVKKARGVIAHSRYVADAVKRMAPRVPVAQIPHEVPEIPRMAQADARARLKLAPDARLIGAFGNLGPTKRTPVLLDAFRAVRRQMPDACLLFVGAASPNFDAQGLINLFDMRDAAQVLGPVPLDVFHAHMAAMDVCVNLRYPTAGETSGAALRIMAHAKPLIVSRVGWFAELPDDAAAKIDVDDHEAARLTQTLLRLLGDAELRAALGGNARRYVMEHCAAADAASYYADFLRAVLEGRAESRAYGKATPNGKRETASVKRETSNVEWQASNVGRETSNVGREINNPQSAIENPVTGWRDEIARAYVALGLEADDAVLAMVARAIVDLGLGR